jgi:hypothetical protein
MNAERLKIWRWWGRDVASLCDLELVAAVSSRRELHALTTRLRLPKAGNDDISQVKPMSPEGQMALGRPGKLVWRGLGQLGPVGDGEWHYEEDLDGLRAASTFRRMGPGGHHATPLHRP